MKAAKIKNIMDALRGCVTAIKSYHNYEYCPTVECDACESRRLAELAIAELSKHQGESRK